MERLLDELSRRKKQAIAVAADCVMLPVALWTAFALRLGEWDPQVASFWPAFVVCVCVAVPVFGRLGLYRQVVRYMGNHAMLTVVTCAFVASMAIYAIAFLIPLTGFPRSVPMIFWMLTLLYVSGTRFGVRAYIQRMQARLNPNQPVIIYSAGGMGVELARLLRQEGQFEPIAFIDDDKKLQRSSIDGIHVYPPKQLAQLLRDTSVNQVLWQSGKTITTNAALLNI